MSTNFLKLTSNPSQHDTPMLRQYLDLKKQVPDCILFFRMGDFYEMFFEDARLANRILGIVLTSRDKTHIDPVPMCGVPYHTANYYLARLVQAGFKVAICEQVEDSRLAKGLVKREIARIVSPGMFTDPEHLAAKEYHYLAAIHFSPKTLGLAFLDLASGEFRAVNLPPGPLLSFELTRLSPAELILAESQQNHFLLINLEQTTKKLPISLHPGRPPKFFQAREILNKRLPVANEDKESALIAAAMLWKMVLSTQRRTPEHVSRLEIYQIQSHLILDTTTQRNLEIFRSIAHGSRQGSLIHAIDYTKTPMGGRLLREWLGFPLLELSVIESRHQAIDELTQHPLILIALEKILTTLPDIPRLVGRASLSQASPRDLATLRDALLTLPQLQNEAQNLTSPLLINCVNRLNEQKKIATLLTTTLTKNPSATLIEGGIIAAGVNPELDNQRKLASTAKGWIADRQASLRTETGIPSLKVGFNKIFGYYIEVTNAHKEKIPNNFFRKQTLAGAERYITPEIKEKEKIILETEEKTLQLERIIFEKLRQQIVNASQNLLSIARSIAILDVLSGLSRLALSQNLVRPQLNEKNAIFIVDGRHLIVERMLETGEFVPNDLNLGGPDSQILIVTGPNMAGKSTILRQVALIILLAQAGSFVPASKAKLPLVDRIFTRVGAMDDLARGQSTFMVEMTETAQILKQATPYSLVILDEVGRGTSTYDGLSIAWAVVEYLHNLQDIGVKTLFATHYHELTELSNIYPRIKNYTVAVKEHQGEIIFLRKLIPGGISRSYGLQVASLAGLPIQVLERASQILKTLETRYTVSTIPSLMSLFTLIQPPTITEPNFFSPAVYDLLTKIKKLKLKKLSPLEAFNILKQLQQKLTQ